MIYVLSYTKNVIAICDTYELATALRCVEQFKAGREYANKFQISELEETTSIDLMRSLSEDGYILPMHVNSIYITSKTHMVTVLTVSERGVKLGASFLSDGVSDLNWDVKVDKSSSRQVRVELHHPNYLQVESYIEYSIRRLEQCDIYLGLNLADEELQYSILETLKLGV